MQCHIACNSAFICCCVVVLLGVDLVVKTMVEVMWAFVASGQVSVQVMVPHLVKMLQAQVSQRSHAGHLTVTCRSHVVQLCMSCEVLQLALHTPSPHSPPRKQR